MTIEDAIKVIDPETPRADARMIWEKNQEAMLDARKLAAEIMTYSVDSSPRVKVGRGGEREALCPRCGADITEGSDVWEYCPFCGQAISWPEER